MSDISGDDVNLQLYDKSSRGFLICCFEDFAQHGSFTSPGTRELWQLRINGEKTFDVEFREPCKKV